MHLDELNAFYVWPDSYLHMQVALANILDMYYEDQYTLPDKQLFCGVGVANFTNLSKNKVVKSVFTYVF